MYNTRGSVTGRFRTTPNGHVPDDYAEQASEAMHIDYAPVEERIMAAALAQYNLKLPGRNRREQFWYFLVWSVSCVCLGLAAGALLAWWILS